MSAAPQYGIGVAKNRFELFDEAEEEDPLELLKRREEEKEERRKAKLAEKENKVRAPPAGKSKPHKVLKETQKTKTVTETIKPRDDKKVKIRKEDNNDRNINNSDAKDYSDRKYHENNGHAHENGVSGGERREYGADGFVRGRGGRRGLPRGVFVRGGGGRGGGGRGGTQKFDPRGKREYDRQSGSDKTGVKPVDKRDGGGAHNWGSNQDEWHSQPEEWQKENEDWSKENEDWNDSNQENANAEKSPKSETRDENGQVQADQGNDSSEAPKDEDAKVDGSDDKAEMTLDEWKALKAPKKSQPSYNIRKPGEGEDLTRWKKMYALNKKKEDEEDTDEEYEYEIGEYPQRVGRQKRILDIDIKFKDTRGGERGRGRGFGRGGPRGGRNSYNRELNHERDRDLPPAPKVDDEKDFPSLA